MKDSGMHGIEKIVRYFILRRPKSTQHSHRILSTGIKKATFNTDNNNTSPYFVYANNTTTMTMLRLLLLMLLSQQQKIPLLLFVCGSGSNSNNNKYYNPYLYDKTVPQFTPDGRLLQVEYANRASDHSTPIVIASITEDLMLICTVRTPTSSFSQMATTMKFRHQTRRRRRKERMVFEQQQVSEKQKHSKISSSGIAADSIDNDIDDSIHSAASIIQQRLIVLQQQHDIVNRLDQVDPIVLGISGIYADSISLLQNTVQDDILYTTRWYGSDTTSTITTSATNIKANNIITPQRIATTIGSKCHERSIYGGIRPYGSNVFVLGIKRRQIKVRPQQRFSSSVSTNTTQSGSSNSHEQRNITSNKNEFRTVKSFVLYKTDPSGAVQEIDFLMHSNNNNNAVVVTGGGDDGMKLEKRLRLENDDEPAMIRRVDKVQIPVMMKNETMNGGINNATSKENEVVADIQNSAHDVDGKNRSNRNDNKSIIQQRIARILSIMFDEYKTTKGSVINDGEKKHSNNYENTAYDNEDDDDWDDEYYLYPAITEALLFSISRGVVQLSPQYMTTILSKYYNTTAKNNKNSKN